MNVWTKEALHRLVKERLSGFRFIAVSNREPYIHTYRDSTIECIQPASGLATAIDPIMRASGGVWVAHGSGTADRQVVDRRDHVAVPPERPAYTLRRVWLPAAVEQGYYYGLANEGLWPLCHIAFQRPRFSQANWDCYRQANECFAEAVLEEAGSEPAFVFIQDYHLGLLPRLLKRSNPKLVVAQFWHIPWPNRETFRAFPWKEELIDGMLGNDLLGFHLPYHCANFLETVDRNIEALVDTERSRVARAGHTTSVRAFPISIDFDHHSRVANSAAVKAEMADWSLLLRGSPEILGIGIDRIDYTKGIIERLNGIDTLLEQRPEYRQRLVFVQVGVPSRTAIADYQNLDREISQRVQEINAKWAVATWEPIVFVHRHMDQQALIALHQMADFCIVSSLHDGMNLVAKEFVASRTDGDGVLILSRFTGAARELTDALLVNPFAPDEIASTIGEAIEMPANERRHRMQRMRTAVSAHNVYRWAGKILQALDGVVAATPLEKFPAPPPRVKAHAAADLVHETA
jgi:trehalose 6-phosphate synthase